MTILGLDIGGANLKAATAEPRAVSVPFALWNKTAFLAERVLGNVVSSGIKVLVLAVIVGIGTGLFAEFTVPPGRHGSRRHGRCG